MFYGIIIRLYLMDNKQHNLPHVHAKYAEFEASIDIVDGEFFQVNCRGSNCVWCRLG
jgi:hypothetical protein